MCWKGTTTFKNVVWLLPRQFAEKLGTLHPPTLDAMFIVLVQDKFPLISRFKTFSRVFPFTAQMMVQIDLLRCWLPSARLVRYDVRWWSCALATLLCLLSDLLIGFVTEHHTSSPHTLVREIHLRPGFGLRVH